MRKIRIKDKVEHVLVYDLIDIVQIISKYDKNLDWFVYFLETEFIVSNFDFVNKMLQQINLNTEIPTQINVNDLMLIGKSLHQTMDAEILVKNKSCEFCIRIVDSDYLEVETDDLKLIEMLKSNFNDAVIYC